MLRASPERVAIDLEWRDLVAAPEIRLDGSGVRLDAAGSTRAVGVTSILPGQIARLEVLGEGLDGETRGCAAYLRFAPDEWSATNRWVENSETPATITRSDHTGAPSEMSGAVALEGSTPEARAESFFRDFGGALGVPRSQIRFVTQATSADGWVTRYYDQAVGAVRVHAAGLELVMDEVGRLRAVSSSLLPGIDEAPGFTRDAASLAAGLSDVVGDMIDAEAVLYGELALRSDGAPGARAGHWVQGTRVDVLLDDESGEVVDLLELEHRATTVEVHEANKLDPSRRVYLELRSRDPNFTTYDPLVVGMSDGAPSVVGPGRGGPHAETLWRELADVANYAERVTGRAGWGAYTPDPIYGTQPLAEGTVRAMIDPLADNAYFLSRPAMLVFDDEMFIQEVDIVCHEYGHSLDHEFGGIYRNGALAEAVADIFAMLCEADVAPSRDPLLIGDREGPVRNLLRPADSGGITHYDDYRRLPPATTREERAELSHRASFLITHAIARAIEGGMPLGHIQAVAIESLGWGDIATVPQFRDRWVARMEAYVGRTGGDGMPITESDVMAMRQGFRRTGLTGEVEDPGSRFGRGDWPPADPTGSGTTSTACDTAACSAPARPTERETLCSPAALQRPTCTNAFGEPICQDAVSYVVAAPGEEPCAMSEDGEQMVRACICVDEGAGPEWAYCNERCQATTEEFPPAAAFGELTVDPPVLTGSSCGNVALPSNPICAVLALTNCESPLCEAPSLHAACSAELDASCHAECDADVEIDPTLTCRLQGESCEDRCAREVTVDCRAACSGEAERECRLHCMGMAMGDTASGTGMSTGQCMTSCRSSFARNCEQSCSVSDVEWPGFDCLRQCEIACDLSVSASATLACEVGCQARGFAECTARLEGGCSLSCMAPSGALFCDGQYVNADLMLEDCISEMRVRHDIDVARDIPFGGSIGF